MRCGTLTAAALLALGATACTEPPSAISAVGPSFIINGTKYAGALPFDDLTSGGTAVNGLNTIIRELLPK